MKFMFTNGRYEKECEKADIDEKCFNNSELFYVPAL